MQKIISAASGIHSRLIDRKKPAEGDIEDSQNQPQYESPVQNLCDKIRDMICRPEKGSQITPEEAYTGRQAQMIQGIGKIADHPERGISFNQPAGQVQKQSRVCDTQDIQIVSHVIVVFPHIEDAGYEQYQTQCHSAQINADIDNGCRPQIRQAPDPDKNHTEYDQRDKKNAEADKHFFPFNAVVLMITCIIIHSLTLTRRICC